MTESIKTNSRKRQKKKKGSKFRKSGARHRGMARPDVLSPPGGSVFLLVIMHVTLFYARTSTYYAYRVVVKTRLKTRFRGKGRGLFDASVRYRCKILSSVVSQTPEIPLYCIRKYKKRFYIDINANTLLTFPDSLVYNTRKPPHHILIDIS